MLVELGSALLMSGPLYLVWLVGAIVALTKLKSHPQVAGLALGGLGVFFLSSLAGLVVRVFYIRSLIESGTSAADIGSSMLVVGILQTLVSMIGWGLLLAAIFVGRSNQPERAG